MDLKIFTKNPAIKIIAIILAVILWLFVKSEMGGEMELMVPLELYDLPSQLIVTHVTAQTINIRINGPFSQLDRFSTKEIRAKVDLSRARPGPNSFDILPSNFSIPQGLGVTQISPSSIKVELDRIVDKTVRVMATVRGSPAKGFRVIRISIDPPHVNLQGARTQLVGIKEVSTGEVDISGLKETVEFEVPLVLSDLKLKKGIDKRVKITIEIRKEKRKR